MTFPVVFALHRDWSAIADVAPRRWATYLSNSLEINMKFRLSLLLLSILLLGGCLNTVFRPAPPAAPPPLRFEDGFRNIGRTECGVPLLNKIPFLSRHFMKTVYGIGDFHWEYNFPNSATVSEDGTWLLVGQSQGGAVSIFNLQNANNHTINLVPSRGDDKSVATWLAMLPDNSAFLVYRIRWNPETPVLETMELFDRETGLLMRAFPIEPGFQTATLSPDGELLYCVGQTSLEAWNVHTGEKAASVPLHTQEGVSQLRCSPNTPWLFLAQSGKVRMFDRHTLSETAPLQAEGEPISIDISPDGMTLMVACSEIRLYEIGSWQLLREIALSNPQHCEFYSIRFSRDGSRLIGRGMNEVETFGATGVSVGKYTITASETSEKFLETFLAEYDLAEPNGQQWKKLEYETLPLHPEGKFLLDGRNRSGQHLSPQSERLREVVQSEPSAE